MHLLRCRCRQFYSESLRLSPYGAGLRLSTCECYSQGLASEAFCLLVYNAGAKTNQPNILRQPWYPLRLRPPCLWLCLFYGQKTVSQTVQNLGAERSGTSALQPLQDTPVLAGVYTATSGVTTTLQYAHL